MVDWANKSVCAVPLRPRYSPLMIVLAAVALGIVADRFYPLSVAVWLAASLLALAAWLLALCCGRQKTACLLILLAAATVAGGRHHIGWSLFAENDIGLFTATAGQHVGSSRPVCLRALVVGGPSRIPAPAYDPMRIIPRMDRTRLELRVEQLQDGNHWRSVAGLATLFVDGHLLDIQAGDRIELTASLCPPLGPRNPGQRDYAAQLRAEGRLMMLHSSRPQSVEKLDVACASPSKTLTLSGWIGSLRHLPERVRAAAGRLLRQYLPQQTQGLAIALLLGSRDQIGRQQRDAFAQTGTIHLLAVSGLHVGILAGMVFGVGRLLRLPRRRGLLLVAVATLCYAVLCGGRPPVVRATVLILILCLSYSMARRTSPYNSLAAAGLVVLALNPADLFRLGAQLSFLAVATIMFFASMISQFSRHDDLLDRALHEAEPLYKKFLRRVSVWYWQATLISLAIWLVALPLVMARFHILTPGSIILTPLLVPFVAIGLASGMVVLISGWLLPPLATAAAVVCDWNLHIIAGIVNAAWRVPYGHFWVSGPADCWLAVFYGILAMAMASAGARSKRRWCFAALIGWVVLGTAVAHFGQRRDGLACTFLAVGHGCATVIELPDGRNILYDAGSLSSADGCAWSVANCLWSRGIRRLDAVVISHADADHYNALPSLIEKVSVGAVYVSQTMFTGPGHSLCSLRESIVAAGIDIGHLQAGDRLQQKLFSSQPNDADSYRIEVLHPAANPLPALGDVEAKTVRRSGHRLDNARSIVLLLEYQGRKIILPGDIEPPGLDALLERKPVDCDVLLVPHHGSGKSNPPGLAAWCRPEIAVISGSLNRYSGQTEKAYKKASARSPKIRVFHTGRAGAVRVEIRNGKISAAGFLERKSLHPTTANNTMNAIISNE